MPRDHQAPADFHPATHPQVRSIVDAKRCEPDGVLAHVSHGDDLIVPIANGEPPTVLDALEAHAEHLHGVRVHQMHALYDRPYLHGASAGHLDHVSYFLSGITRRCYADGHLELVPNHFSEVPLLLRQTTRRSLVLARSSPPDRHGYFSLGTNADYVASFIGRVPFFLEATPAMPRTFGQNHVHISQVAGWCATSSPLLSVDPAPPNDLDRRIAALVADRIPNGATIQAGIGAIPNAVMAMLHDHRDLGVHTELVSDGIVELAELGVVTGTRKVTNPGKIVTTFALGTDMVYEFLDENPAVEFRAVEYVNNPRTIATEPNFVSINATLEIDMLGQCASESIGSSYISSSGGQADFARGAMYSDGGQAFMVLHSMTSDGRLSRIRPQLTPGAAVTTLKNTVDNVVTEWGVAELRGRSIRQRAKALINVAHPDVRDDLTREALELGYL